MKKYEIIEDHFKKKIQSGDFPVDSLLPSEYDICARFSATRTTVRKALDELLREGYIKKEHGRGSRVIERIKTLGLPSVKGFSNAMKQEGDAVFTQEPIIQKWSDQQIFALSDKEGEGDCVYFQRLRLIDQKPVLVENNWYSGSMLELVRSEEFLDGSFFKTLSQRFHIDIIGVEQEIMAKSASAEIASMLTIQEGDPVLFIAVRYQTSLEDFHIYGSWFCNTEDFPIVSNTFS